MINLMTYNIRYDNPADGVNVWANRKEAVAKLIKTKSVHVLGVQEALYQQVIDLQQTLPHFDWVGVGRDNGGQHGEFMAIFYDKDALELIEHGHFWLSETPHIAGSCAWETACPRMVTWAKLKEKQTEQVFYHFNTHLDHKSRQARRESIYLLNKKISEIAGQTRAILTGDFNLTPKEAEYTLLTDYFTDLRTKFPEKNFNNSTFNNFGQQGVSGMTIDFIFAHLSRYLVCHSFDILENKYNNRFPSDHFPLLVTLEFIY